PCITIIMNHDYESCAYVNLPEVIRRVELCFFRPCAKLTWRKVAKTGKKTWSSGRQRSTTWLSLLNAKLLSIYSKPCAMYLILLHFHHCAVSESDCNCCCLI